jgi:hypothetical protein
MNTSETTKNPNGEFIAGLASVPRADVGPRSLPEYRSHKIVNALKIVAIDEQRPQVSDGQSAQAWHPATLRFEGDFEPAQVDAEWMRSRRPQVGGYWVLYKDGYTSWSPAKQFDEGYIPSSDWGLRVQQEDKYQVDAATGRLVNTFTGAAIPDDEPVVIFRAKDAVALEALTAYHYAVKALLEADNPEVVHVVDSIEQKLAAFRAFRESHQDRLRNPT